MIQMDLISTGKITSTPLTQKDGIRATILHSIITAQPSVHRRPLSIVAILSSKWSQMISTTKGTGEIQMSTGLQKRASLFMMPTIHIMATVMDIGDTMATMSGDHIGATIAAWNILQRIMSKNMVSITNSVTLILTMMTTTSAMNTIMAMTHGTESTTLNTMNIHTNSCTMDTHLNFSKVIIILISQVVHITMDIALTTEWDHLVVMDIHITWNHHGMRVNTTGKVTMIGKVIMNGMNHITQMTHGLRKLAKEMHLKSSLKSQAKLLRRRKRSKSQRKKSQLLVHHLLLQRLKQLLHHLHPSLSQRKKHQRRLNHLRRKRNQRKWRDNKRPTTSGLRHTTIQYTMATQMIHIAILLVIICTNPTTVDMENGMNPIMESGMSHTTENGMSPITENGMSPITESGMNPTTKSGMNPITESLIMVSGTNLNTTVSTKVITTMLLMATITHTPIIRGDTTMTTITMPMTITNHQLSTTRNFMSHSIISLTE